MKVPNIEKSPVNFEESGRNWGKLFTGVGIAILVLNVVVLDYFVGFQGFGVKPDSQRIAAVEQQMWSLTRRLADLSFESTPSGDVPLIVFPTISIPTHEPTPTVEPNAEGVTPTPTPASIIRELYVPLGSAAVKTENYTWTDTAAEATVNISNYPSIQQITFEAALSVPSGQVEARLVNTSGGGIIGGSTLIGDGGTPVLYKSGGISLPSGVGTYRVQMRTSLDSEGSLDFSRLRILLN